MLSIYHSLILSFTAITLVSARAVHKPTEYELTHQTIRRPHCMTDSECLNLGLPFIPPPLPHSDKHQRPNPLDGVIYTCGPAQIITVTEAMAGPYMYELVGGSGGSATETVQIGDTGAVKVGSIDLEAGTQITLQPGCRGYDSDTSGGDGGPSLFFAPGINTLVRARGGKGAEAGGAPGAVAGESNQDILTPLQSSQSEAAAMALIGSGTGYIVFRPV